MFMLRSVTRPACRSLAQYQASLLTVDHEDRRTDLPWLAHCAQEAIKRY
jgi:hypothetical protein